MNTKIKILLAESHKILCESLRISFEKHGDIEVIAQAEDGLKAVQLARELKPDVVLIDITLTGLNGIEATRQIISEVPGAKVIALTKNCDSQSVSGMLRAGASGYLIKDCGFEELADAIRAVMTGQIYLSPRITGIVVQELVQQSSKANRGGLSALTPRERQVLQLLAEGKTTRQIALPLKMSVKTVETHRSNIMKKLRVSNIAELTKFAIREGLTTLEA